LARQIGVRRASSPIQDEIFGQPNSGVPGRALKVSTPAGLMLRLLMLRVAVLTPLGAVTAARPITQIWPSPVLYQDLADPTLHFDAQTRLHLGMTPDEAFPDSSKRRPLPRFPGLLRACRAHRVCALLGDAWLAWRAMPSMRRTSWRPLRRATWTTKFGVCGLLPAAARSSSARVRSTPASRSSRFRTVNRWMGRPRLACRRSSRNSRREY
jgi:hypothetical protein